jgi:hypothetical protein
LSPARNREVIKFLILRDILSRWLASVMGEAPACQVDTSKKIDMLIDIDFQ